MASSPLGQLVTTPMVRALSPMQYLRLLQTIRTLPETAFTEDNDPYREHDFGKVVQNEEVYYWKIDYYDRTLQYGAQDPTDTQECVRVLTVMHASEY